MIVFYFVVFNLNEDVCELFIFIGIYKCLLYFVSKVGWMIEFEILWKNLRKSWM